MKYIVVTGGVISGIGKGVVTSSMGALLKACNLDVTAIKIDPYINIDAGTFSPYQHGEVFVLNDGCEVDLDLGNYERFLEVELQRNNNITTGKIYQQVIDRERKGDYLGETVQIVPHITDAIQDWIETTAKGSNPKKVPQICLIELGGTVGDIESMPFIEALRQLQRKVKKDNFCLCHVNLVPCIGPKDSKELKSKPTQASVRELKSLGLFPDMIVCRSEIPITDSIIEKISNFCDVEKGRVFSLPDLKTIYRVPLELQKQGVIRAISECLKINVCACDRLKNWETISDAAVNARTDIIIALVGKYTGLGDAYISVVKSLEHACYSVGAKPKIQYIDSALLETQDDNEAWQKLKTSHCLLVPGGFGIRGIEGKINAIRWARENKFPFLGICLGFQLAVVEYARNVLTIENAHSAEFIKELAAKDFKSVEPMVDIVVEMLEYHPDQRKGGTMRLGLRKTKFVTNDSITKKLYDNQDVIEERHRHRYEINLEYIERLQETGLKFVGKSEDETRMEILELDSSTHPYFVAVQYHPEYLSRPFKPSPPYKGLIIAAREYSQVPRL